MVIDAVKKRYRYPLILLKELVRTDFKLRYQGSVLGYIWSLLRPLFMFVILYFVFTVFLPVGRNIEHAPVYLLIGIVLWNYFNEVTTGSIGAIVGKSDLMRKINFPKYVVLLAVVAAALINFSLNLVVVVVFMFLNHVTFHWSMLLAIPIFLELTALAIGLAFLLSALFVKYRDITYVWEVVMQAGFYGTPILYPLQEIVKHSPKVAELLILNPVAQIIQGIRYYVVTPQTLTFGNIYNDRPYMWVIPLGIVCIFAVGGALYFRSRSKYFAEEA